MQIAILSLGSNIGDRVFFLKEAKKMLISDKNKFISQSEFYETEPWKVQKQNNYINQILHLETSQSPFLLLQQILNIEKKLGRIRNQKWDARTIDIDILFYDNAIIQTPHLSIPHPFLQERNFIMTPIIDMGLGNFLHPILNKTIFQLSQETSDQHCVIKYNLSSLN